MQDTSSTKVLVRQSGKKDSDLNVDDETYRPDLNLSVDDDWLILDGMKAEHSYTSPVSMIRPQYVYTDWMKGGLLTCLWNVDDGCTHQRSENASL